MRTARVAPGSLLSSGTEVVGCTSGSTLTGALITPQSLTAGTPYWIGFITDTSVVLEQSDERRDLGDEDRVMTIIRAAKLAREALLTGPPVFRVDSIVRETLVSGSGAVLPSDVVIRVAALAREALLADTGTFRVAAIVREALVSEAEAPPPSDVAPRFWVTVLG